MTVEIRGISEQVGSHASRDTDQDAPTRPSDTDQDAPTQTNAPRDGEDFNPGLLKLARSARDDFARLLMEHQFAVDEVLTKVSILQREFLHLHSYNPIEHVTSRVKPAESILEKLIRRGLEPSVPSARQNLTDIAGVRIVCSFIADCYRVMEALTSQDDVDVVIVKDYIEHPKPNGYKSLHVIASVPVYLSTGPVPLHVEVQIRTIAMDFWASLEHKIHYKYSGAVPDHLVESLTETAQIAEQLDRRMEQLHSEVRGTPDRAAAGAGPTVLDEQALRHLWRYAQGEADASRSPGSTQSDGQSPGGSAPPPADAPSVPPTDGERD